MSSTLSDATVALRRTLIAGSTYATLRVAQLFFLTIFLPKKEAAVFALIVCLTTAVSKFIDAGAGAAMPRFLSMPIIKQHIGKILFIQFLFILPLIIFWMITLSVIPAPLFVIPAQAGTQSFSILATLALILFLATCEAIASVGRHAIYSTLQSVTLMKTEVGLKAIKVFSLPLLLCCFGLTGPVVIAHFVFFHFISSTAIILLACRQCFGGLRIGSRILARDDRRSFCGDETTREKYHSDVALCHPGRRRQGYAAHSQSCDVCARRSYQRRLGRDPGSNPLPLAHHITVLKLRWQVFSTKIGRDLLSSYVLTPLFAYTYGLEYTWFFYSATTIISAIQTTIKMAITYTAAGAFSQLSSNLHHAAASRLNKMLTFLIGIGCGIAAMLYAISVTAMDSGIQSAALCITCFAIITFLDMASTVYEQQFLIAGSYARFQYIRLLEYSTMAIIGIVGGKLCTIPTIATLFVLNKIIILIIVRARAVKLTELSSPPHVSTPPVHTPAALTPAPNAPKPTSSQAPAQREGL